MSEHNDGLRAIAVAIDNHASTLAANSDAEGAARYAAAEALNGIAGAIQEHAKAVAALAAVIAAKEGE